MRIRTKLVLLTALGFLAASVRATIITVTNTVGTGAGSLGAAISGLHNGDTIAFDIRGAGPHYITPPAGGFAVITNLNDLLIDGYTQPGSSPNDQTILAANNADLKIVLDASGGQATDLTALGVPGFPDNEAAVLPVLGCSNVTIRGICFLGPGDGLSSDYCAIALGGRQPSRNCHIAGCRFGLDVDNTTI